MRYFTCVRPHLTASAREKKLKYSEMDRQFDYGNLTGRATKGQRYLLLIISVLTALVLAGCGAMSGGNSEPDLWGPFRSQSNWIVDDGSLRLEIFGYERGHRPGLESEFELTVDNGLDEPLDTTICVMLVDEVSVIQYLGDFQVQLPPGAATGRSIVAAFDPEIESRPYGLTIVVQDWGAIVVTVRLGIPDEEAGPWLDASELECPA